MVHRDSHITWQGEDHSFSPSFRFLRSMDAKLQGDPERPTNLIQIAYTIRNGGKEIMDIPVVWAAFLKEAGIEATEDDCWVVVSSVVSGYSTESQKADYHSFANALAGAVAPGVEMGKPPAHQARKVPDPKRKKTAP